MGRGHRIRGHLASGKDVIVDRHQRLDPFPHGTIKALIGRPGADEFGGPAALRHLVGAHDGKPAGHIAKG